MNTPSEHPAADSALVDPALTDPDRGLVDSHTLTPSDRWLAAAAAFMPPLPGPAGVAERLLLHVHYGIDWQTGWISNYRTTYWDQQLPDRVITATYLADSLRRWWRHVADELGSRPRSAAERIELEHLLRQQPQPLLEVLRFEAEPLLLRTRIVADAVREARAERTAITGADLTRTPPSARTTGPARKRTR